MASDNQVVIVGNLTRTTRAPVHPERRGLVKFGVAVSRRCKDDATGQVEGRRHVVLHRQRLAELAENVAESLTRGTRVVVAGRLQTRSWETPEGEKRRSRSRSRPTRSAPACDGPPPRWRSRAGPPAREWSARRTVGAPDGSQEETPLDA